MRARFALLFLAGTGALAVMGASLASNPISAIDTAQDAQTALRLAELQGREARVRAEGLERTAASAVAAADRTAQEGAALAARVQEAEAGIATNEARVRLIGQQRAALRAELAQRQRPLVELTAALQRLSRRPAVFALLRPGSLSDTVHLRAVLETMLPEVGRRTAGLRAAIARGRQLQAAAETVGVNLRASQSELRRRRQQLMGIEVRQRLDSRTASGIADREAERALGLAEQARDLATLVGRLDEAGRLRERLGALPGPLLRPAAGASVPGPQLPEQPAAAAADAPPPPQYLLPVAGRLVAGFGDSGEGRVQSRGISLAPRGGAQVVAPGGGRVVFAGPYQSYGVIVIVEHGGGWTSLVTGLAVLDARVGQTVVAGSPLGLAPQGRPVLTLELRKDGIPFNPLDYLKR